MGIIFREILGDQSFILRFAQSHKILLILLVFTFSFFQNIPCRADIASGLVGWWKLNDGSGSSAADSSGNGNTGTLQGSPTWVTGGKPYPITLSFNGTNQYVSSGAVFSSMGTVNAPYTISAWVYLNQSQNGDIIDFWSGGWCLPFLNESSNVFHSYSWNGGLVTVNGVITINQNQWYHIAAVWNSTSGLVLYVNGQVDNSTAQNAYGASGSNDTLTVAEAASGCSGTTNHYFPGYVDDVRVYNRALSAADIAQLYKVQSTVILNHAHFSNFHS